MDITKRLYENNSILKVTSMKTEKLNHENLLDVIKLTPLVSVDLIIRDIKGRVLLGMRTNRPARDYWFVPGGRICKNETIAHALARISLAEIGHELTIEQVRLQGGFDHIYEDNFAGEEDISTHYVVLAYQAVINDSVQLSGDSQHSDLKWWTVEDLLASDKVHPNTKAYFK